MDIRLTLLLTWATISTIFAAVAIGLWVWSRPRMAASAVARDVARPTMAGETLVLPIALHTDPDAAARLADELADQALARDAELERVEVVDRDGRTILTRPRTSAPRVIALPEVLHEPRLARRHAPSPVGGSWSVGGSGPPPPGTAPAPLGQRPAADRFRLPEPVRDLLTDADDHLEVIRAVLAASGTAVTRHGDLLDAGDLAVVLVSAEDDADHALGYGYLRLQSSSAPTKVLVHLGYVPPQVLARHRAAAPAIHHADTRTIQQLADAVAVGLDPQALLLP